MDKDRTSAAEAQKLKLIIDNSEIADCVTLKKYRNKQPMFILKGVVEPGQTAEFSINGLDFTVGPDTWTFGEFKIGVVAKVEGTMNIDARRYARKIVVTVPH